MELKKIAELIVTCLEEVKKALDEENVGPIDFDTRIFGRKGLLDSMGLVSLITDLEERIEEEFGVSLILADERAMSQKKSPFLTVSSLAQYVGMLMKEEEQ